MTTTTTTSTTTTTFACGTFLSTWGDRGDGDGQFNFPTGIAVDAGGTVSVVDALNYRVQQFTDSGTFLRKWGSVEDFSSPRDIAVDGVGNIFVVDHDFGVRKFSSTGDDIAKRSTSSIVGVVGSTSLSPRGIGIDQSGGVFVSLINSGINARIAWLANVMTTIAVWGSWGSVEGQLDMPSGIAADANGDIFIADTGNNRIQKFTSTGILLTAWGSLGSGNGQFNYPVDVALDRNGNVFVADVNNNRVQKFTNAGAFVTRWGSAGTGSGPGQFHQAGSLAIDANNNVFVADTNNNRIQKFACP